MIMTLKSSLNNFMIQDGHFVFIERGEQVRICKIGQDQKVSYGKGRDALDINVGGAIGFSYLDTFRIRSRPLAHNGHGCDQNEAGKKRKGAGAAIVENYLEIASKEEVEERKSISQKILSESCSSKDNRELVEGSTKGENFKDLQRQGVKSQDILSAIASSSESFTKKTEYSQEKFLKKKERIYGDIVKIVKPNLLLLAQFYFQRDTFINNNPSTNLRVCLRPDTLSQILTYGNIHHGGRYLVYENGCSGLLIAGVLQRMGGKGTLLHLNAGTAPKREAVYHLNLPLSSLQPLNSLDIYFLIRPPRKKIQNDPISVLDDSNDAKSTDLQTKTETDSNEEPAKKVAKLEVEQPSETEADIVRKKIERGITLLENANSQQILNDSCFHSLIICGKEHPLSILQKFICYLSSSATIVVYCMQSEPLMDCYVWLKEASLGVNLNISENFFRDIQVDEDRTHPFINTNTNGGYILTGIYTSPDST